MALKYRMRSFMDGLEKKWAIEYETRVAADPPYTYYTQVGGSFSDDYRCLAEQALARLKEFKEEIIE